MSIFLAYYLSLPSSCIAGTDLVHKGW